MQPKLVRMRPSLLVPPSAKRPSAPQVKPSSDDDDYVETVSGRYRKVRWTGKNEAGFKPAGEMMLVMIDEAAGKSKGGIHFSDELQDKTGQAAITGALVALGDEAFTWNRDRTRRYEGEKPKPGQRIYFSKYAGEFLRGRDGRMYRLMEDGCLGGLED